MKRGAEALRAGIDKVLIDMGGLYSFEDIVDAVKRGDMQSFASGDAWAVTQISNFPRKTVLEIVFACGDKDQLEEMYSEIIGFAKEHNIQFAMTMAREGWTPDAIAHGWEKIGAVLFKDLSDGS